MNNPPFSRRHFVKTFALGTAASTVFGKVWQASVLADVTPSNVGQLRVKVSDYPALSNDFGSVRLGINPINNPTIPLGDFYPVLINHLSGATYYAMSTYCSHQGCIVPPFDEEMGAMVCPCHGSTFRLDGSKAGGPASSSLTRYPLTYDGVDSLTIQIPNLGYCVTTALVQSSATPKLSLSFPTFENVEYEVKFREHIQDAWSTVPFAFSLNDAVDQISIFGDGSPVEVYVNRTTATGFFSIAIKIFDLTQG